jgi:hypothetical protein
VVLVTTAADRDARRAVWMIFGLLAIPFLAVTSAALAADIASTTDPTAALIGVPATLIGVAFGVGILRLAAAMHSGAVAVCAALLAAADRGAAMIEPLRGLRVPTQAVRPMPVLLPVSTGRRGPPFVRES